MDNEFQNKKVYEKDSRPYYGKDILDNINKNIDYVTVSSNKPKQKYDNIYPNDRMPYYGPINNENQSIKFLNNGPKDKFLTPIEIKDLSDIIDSEENKKRLEKEIVDINNSYDVNRDEVYRRDPRAYYDPSMKSKEQRKEVLKGAIDQISKDLILQQPEFTEENFKVKTNLQNYNNLNLEKDNKYIIDNYWSETKENENSKFYNELKKLIFFFIKYFFLENTINTSFDIGTEAKENKHKIYEANDKTRDAQKVYYPSKNKKYEAEEISSSNRLDNKIEGNILNIKIYF